MAPFLPPASAKHRSLCPMEKLQARNDHEQPHRRPRFFPEGIRKIIRQQLSSPAISNDLRPAMITQKRSSSTEAVPRKVSENCRGTSSLPLGPMLPPATAQGKVSLFHGDFRTRNLNKTNSIVHRCFFPERCEGPLRGTPSLSLAPCQRHLQTTGKQPCSTRSSGSGMISNTVTSSIAVVPRTASKDFRGIPLLPLSLLLPPAPAKQRSLFPIEKNARPATITNAATSSRGKRFT